MTQEPLEFLPLEGWCELQSAFKKDWPRGISGYSVLEIQRQWATKGIDYDFKVYCPFGDVKNGMVAVNEKNDFYEIIIQCPSDDTENLRDALRKTKFIDWKRSIIVPYAPHNVIECIKKLVQDIDVEIRLILPSETFILEAKSPFYKDVNLPPSVIFDLISMDHLDIINSTWPHRYPNSSSYFQLLINTKFGYGLFVNNTLISWVFINESGNLLHMYTIEEFRKKGYAALLLKLVSNILLKDGKDVSAYCLIDNVNACKLYKNAGFVRSDGVAWCYLNSTLK